MLPTTIKLLLNDWLVSIKRCFAFPRRQEKHQFDKAACNVCCRRLKYKCQHFRREPVRSDYLYLSPLILGLYPDVDELRNKINSGEEIKLPKNLVMHARNNERAIRQTSLSVAKYKTHEQQTANIVASTISRKSHPLDGRVSDFLPKSE